MTDPANLDLRDLDLAVLQHVEDGNDDTQKITSATVLETHQVRYSLEKLAELDLIALDKPDEMVTREVDGQKRVFQHPLNAELTDEGRQYIEQLEFDVTDSYSDLSKAEAVNRLKSLESRVDGLENRFETFQRQVKQKLSD